MIDRLMNTASRISTWLVWLAGALMIGSAILVTGEVAARKFFNVSLGGADELSGYAFGVATSLALSYALFERAHIRVDAGYAMFPRWLRLIADLLGQVLLLGFALIVSITAWSMVADTIEYGSRSITPMRTPLIIAQGPWLFGWLFFVFCSALMLIAVVQKLLRGDRAGVDKLIGVKSMQELIEDESA